MKTHYFTDLLCGYHIEAYDAPKQVSKDEDVNYIALPIERSPVHCLFSIGYPSKAAFMVKLAPIAEMQPERRDRALREALGKWIDEHKSFLLKTQQRHTLVPCNGGCDAEICLEATP